MRAVEFYLQKRARGDIIVYMKFRFTAALCAAAVLAASVPFFSGCKPRENYVLNADANGDKYYTLSIDHSENLNGEFIIPAYYGEGEDYAPVRVIGKECFALSGITSVSIPETVTEISNMAFASCSSLKKVEIAAGSALSCIGRGAFAQCGSLRDVSLPEGLEILDVGAFTGCESLSEIILPQSLKTLGDECFYNTGLTSITVPAVEYFGNAAFHNCPELVSAVVEEGVTDIRSSAFGYCLNLKTVTLPASLEQIRGAEKVNSKSYAAAFAYDSALTTVNYGGSAEMWTSLQIGGRDVDPDDDKHAGDSNGYLTRATKNFNYGQGAD